MIVRLAGALPAALSAEPPPGGAGAELVRPGVGARPAGRPLPSASVAGKSAGSAASIAAAPPSAASRARPG